MESTSMLWRRLDLPGHDSAILAGTPSGVQLRGMAVFSDGGATALQYTVNCDPGWRTTEAVISGWCPSGAVALHLLRDAAGQWTLNGARVPNVTGCVDLDLSFTPATNLLPLRRLGLTIGDAATVRSAWLEWPDVRLTPLVQRYARRSLAAYDYEADLPGTEPFAGALRVDEEGWVHDYAGLWQAEAGV